MVNRPGNYQNHTKSDQTGPNWTRTTLLWCFMEICTFYTFVTFYGHGRMQHFVAKCRVFFQTFSQFLPLFWLIRAKNVYCRVIDALGHIVLASSPSHWILIVHTHPHLRASLLENACHYGNIYMLRYANVNANLRNGKNNSTENCNCSWVRLHIALTLTHTAVDKRDIKVVVFHYNKITVNCASPCMSIRDLAGSVSPGSG